MPQTSPSVGTQQPVYSRGAHSKYLLLNLRVKAQLAMPFQRVHQFWDERSQAFGAEMVAYFPQPPQGVAYRQTVLSLSPTTTCFAWRVAEQPHCRFAVILCYRAELSQKLALLLLAG